MSKFRKMTAVILSVVMFVCCFSVTAGAESIYDSAKSITSGKTYSIQLYNYEDTADYKITSSTAGGLVIKLTSQTRWTDVYLYDSNGNTLNYSQKDISSGSVSIQDSTLSDLYGAAECVWNDTVERFTGSLTYGIKKGTYYIRFYRGSSSGNGKISFSVTVPSSSSSGKLTGIVVPIKVGATMQLSVAASGSTSGSVTWSSSKTSVAAVSSTGKVTAKKKGTATITAKLGSSTAKLVIQVS